MKKVIVTGATGFIGRHSLLMLVEKGYEVHAVSSQIQNQSNGLIQWHAIDLLNSDQASQIFKEIKPSHLLHFAWYAVPCKFWDAPQNLDWVRASINIVQNFHNNGGERLVVAGSCAEYDWSDGYCHETNTPSNPNTLYGASKRALGILLEQFTANVGLNLAWGRIFHLFGPHEAPQRFLSSVIKSLVRNEPVLCSHGNQLRDFLHVEDVAHAFVTLLDSDVRGVVNVASGEAISLKELGKKIEKMMGKENCIQFGARPTSPKEPPKILADINRLTHELKWKPNCDIDTRLNQTIAWWQAQEINV
jgi:nucleoside-diphosphate-sugar epimerase